jgi:hypothetical protein
VQVSTRKSQRGKRPKGQGAGVLYRRGFGIGGQM